MTPLSLGDKSKELRRILPPGDSPQAKVDEAQDASPKNEVKVALGGQVSSAKAGAAPTSPETVTGLPRLEPHSSSTDVAAPVPRTRLQYGDIMRALGCVAVVGVHASMTVSEEIKLVGTPGWWYAAVYDGAVRWAVPVFLMLSGALLLEPCPGETAWAFYRKRLRRLGPVLLFWPAFYLVWRAYYEGDLRTTHDMLWSLLTGLPFYHLHFLFALPGLYFFTPMLRDYVRHAAPSQVRLLAVGIVAITVLAGGVQELRGVGLDRSHNGLTRFLPFLGFFVAGFALRDVVLLRRGLILAALGFLLSIAIYAVGTDLFVARRPFQPWNLYFSTQYSLTRYLGGMCAFLLIANLFRGGTGRPALDRLISQWLAPASLGIYLIHPVFLALWNKGLKVWCDWPGLAVTWPNIWLGLPLTWLLAWTASFLTVLAWQRIPYARRLIG